jgi:hypothetical protein
MCEYKFIFVYKKIIILFSHATFKLFTIPCLQTMDSRMKRWVGHVVHMETKINPYKDLVRKTKGNRSLVRPGCRWEYNIKINLTETEDSVDWIHLVLNRTSGGRL